jgi:hypothetical protein
MRDAKTAKAESGQVTCPTCGETLLRKISEKVNWPKRIPTLGGEIVHGPPHSMTINYECKNGHVFSSEHFFQ